MENRNLIKWLAVMIIVMFIGNVTLILSKKIERQAEADAADRVLTIIETFQKNRMKPPPSSPVSQPRR